MTAPPRKVKFASRCWRPPRAKAKEPASPRPIKEPALAQPTVEQLNALLSAALARPARIVASEPTAFWSVMRCTLEGSPTSVVVKWRRDGPPGVRTDPRQVATERAALEFLGEIGFAEAPRLIAADLGAGVLVLEDLSPRTPLAEQIRERGPDAVFDDIIAFGRASGALAAATVGAAAAYERRRRRYGDPDPAVGRAGALGPHWTEGRNALANLGRPLSAAAERDLDAVRRAMLEPGPFLAFSNGDPHPNNFMTDGCDGRLIDFEGADFRHALVSAVWIHVPGPAWMSVAHPRSAEVEAAYRTALARGIPEAEDDSRFGFGMAAAALAEACDRIGRFEVLDARPVGDSSRVHRVAAIDAAVRVARRWDALPDLAGWMEDTAKWLRKRWPDADVDIAALPPYTPRT